MVMDEDVLSDFVPSNIVSRQVSSQYTLLLQRTEIGSPCLILSKAKERMTAKASMLTKA
jgi:hypothetical protein